MNSRSQLLNGGDSGPAIVEGDSKNSLFMELISGVVPERLMPENGPKLSDGEIELFRKWIDAKAPWPEHVRLSRGKETPRPIQSPEIPKSTDGLNNPIDLILQKTRKLKNSF